MEVGSESDSRSLDMDSLSVDDYSEPRLSSESGTTVIHVSADNSLESSVTHTQHLSSAAPEVSMPTLSKRTSLTTLQTSL